MPRIGVFVCHCGHNIAGTVDVERVSQTLLSHPDVVFSTNYIYMCSEPGQALIRRSVVDYDLDGVVVAACTPNLHAVTFGRAVEKAGIPISRIEIANIREQCSWVHDDMSRGTAKAIRLTWMAVEKLVQNEFLELLRVPIRHRSALVIGGGIAGIQAALDIADAGYKVYLVEKRPTIGGHMAQLSETFPTLDCSSCILTPKMVDVEHHPLIEIITNAEVMDISGSVGDFRVRVVKRPRYVIEAKCTVCNDCVDVCPVVTYNEFEAGLGARKAIYIPFPQAVPSAYVIDRDACLNTDNLIVCENCFRACKAKAIDFAMSEEVLDLEVGSIVVATGYDLMPVASLKEYGADTIVDVIDGLQFERLLSASGPTGGSVIRPSDGSVPMEVVFVQCAGSRDPEHGVPYCSSICCMYTAKHALLYKHAVPDGQAYVFYIDIRTAGKGYEEFVQKAIEEEGILYLRGKVSKIYEEDGKVVVHGVDTLTGSKVEIKADLVVLATAILPSPDAKKLAKLLHIQTDEFGFLNEAHPKLRPVESLTSGIYIAGCAQAPKDIPYSVAQGSGAASKVLSLFSQKEIVRSPEIAVVNVDACSGCRICINVCPYGAITFDESDNVADVNAVLCEGCGTCVAACPSGALHLRNMEDDQIRKMIDAVLIPFSQEVI